VIVVNLRLVAIEGRIVSNTLEENDFANKPPDSAVMNDITLVLQSINHGDAQTADQLLGQVYEQLRALAHSRMRQEPGGAAGMTLDATALVHEAYLRVAWDDKDHAPKVWENRGHFFGAAALAMRRILVERARHRGRIKHGGGRDRVELNAEQIPMQKPEHDRTDLVALDEALTCLEQIDARKAKIVSLRFFAGLSIDETAAAMDLSPATIKNEWAFARAWLHRQVSGEKQ
jgi:RNA polymerase sigma factor (TIGR02999 family)